MNDISLLEQIAEEMHIRKGRLEKRDHWKARIIYSAIGRLALASLSDRLDSPLDNISKVHFTSRVKELYHAYLSTYPELTEMFIQNSDFITNIIYNEYESTGYFYHEPYRLRAAIESQSNLQEVQFIRGAGLNSKVRMSGLGMYNLNTTTDSSLRFVDMFQIDQISLMDVVPEILQQAEWRKSDIPEYSEYLCINDDFKYGYWKSKPDSDTNASLMRFGLGKKEYALYKMKDDLLQLYMLPKWQYEDRQYFLIANALLYEQGILPPIRYHRDESVVTFKLGYLLPHHEQNILMLYSWPNNMNCEKPTLQYLTNRDMDSDVFFAVYDVLESLGYDFMEV